MDSSSRLMPRLSAQSGVTGSMPALVWRVRGPPGANADKPTRSSARHSGLACNLPDGARPHRLLRVALDVAVINTVGANHAQRTITAPGQAAVEYSDRKRRLQDTAQKCRDAGLDFVPIVFEHQGGTTKEAIGVLHSIAAAVANLEARETAEVREEMFGRIAVVLARAGAAAVARRRRRISACSPIGACLVEAALDLPHEPGQR